MANVVMFDSAFAPTREQARQLSTRARLWGGYLGGKRAYHAWSLADFATVRAAGFGVVAFYVGPQRDRYSDVLNADVGRSLGADAVQKAKERALGVEVPLLLDMEDSSVDAGGIAYCAAWARAVRGAGYRPGLYSRAAIANAAGRYFDCLHLANYPKPTPTNPSPDHIPGIPDDFMRGRRAWQYHNSHSEGGVTVDTSVCDEWFMEVQKHMSINRPACSIAFTPSGRGYWIAAEDGGVFAFGDAQYHGGMAGKPLDWPIVDLTPTPSGKGYLLLGADGGVFAFGDATYMGRPGERAAGAAAAGSSGAADGTEAGSGTEAADSSGTDAPAPAETGAAAPDSIVLDEPEPATGGA
jgi:hypothetical protein